MLWKNLSSLIYSYSDPLKIIDLPHEMQQDLK